MNKVHVLIVDDQILFAQSLKMYLTNYADDMEIIGICEDGNKAVEFVRVNKPDVILMDVYMPGMNGVRATRCIKTEFPDVKIIMLSTYDEDENVKAAILAGAAGYLLKDISPTELILSIRALQTNIMQISPSIVQKLVRNQLLGEKNGIDEEERKYQSMQWYKMLTNREKEVFVLIAMGYGNKRISDELSISEQTVRNQVSAIYAKLGVKDRFEIIRLANQS
jgi:DNA-binding NarL/FixJ family response regulator